MSKSQLRKYVADYAESFPGPEWKPFEGIAFTRCAGPFQQMIWFEHLRSGAYRPTMSISVIAFHGRVQHVQHLDVKHREILPSEHARMRDAVVVAMGEQFTPPVATPLDAKETLSVCEQSFPGTLGYCCGLAAANASMGHIDRALYWCDRLQKSHQQLGRAPVGWELEHIDFGKSLRQAITEHREGKFLKASWRVRSEESTG